MKRIDFIYFLMVIFLISSCTSKEEKMEKEMKTGMEKLRANDNRGAIEDFSKVILLSPQSYEAYYYRANAHFNLKQAKGALLDYDKAIGLKPDYKEAYYNRGFCKQYLKDKEGACADWKKCKALGMADVGDLIKECR